MKVLVDTCVWSKALRYKSSDLEIAEKMKELIKNGVVVMIRSPNPGISRNNHKEFS